MPEYKFLVVEDSPTMRQLISFALKRIPGSAFEAVYTGDILRTPPP
jgi:CheY-like chemotaxis protein